MMEEENTIDNYIEKFPDNIQAVLCKIRQVILSTNSELGETIKYGIPTFVFHGNLVHFAAHKKHIGFYPAPSGIEAFKECLKEYSVSKGCVQFPYTKPIPYDLIAEITLYRIDENKEIFNKKQLS